MGRLGLIKGVFDFIITRFGDFCEQKKAFINSVSILDKLGIIDYPIWRLLNFNF